MNETHIIGNQGEAPVDTANDWECLPLWEKLQQLADDIDASSFAWFEETGKSDPSLDDISERLASLSQEVFEYCKRNGVTL